MEKKHMPARILIIDDERDMLVLLHRILSERMDCEVTLAEDPLRVWELFEEEDFDVVITDVKMPGLNGFQILEAVKRTSARTAVIIMTACGSSPLLVEAARKGAFECIMKPFRKETLLKVVERAIESLHPLRRLVLV